jgi:flagellar brake protein
MIIDCSHHPDVQKSLLSADKLVFVTFIESIKIQFSLDEVQEKIIADGKPALRFKIPEELMRLQRRNHFRVQTPKGEPLLCFMPMPDHPDRGVNVEVFDISLGGIAVIHATSDVRLAPGMIFSRCRVSIPDVGELVTDIEIRHVPADDGTNFRSIGCKFVNVPANMVNLLQRYIIQVERAKRINV